VAAILEVEAMAILVAEDIVDTVRIICMVFETVCADGCRVGGGYRQAGGMPSLLSSPQSHRAF
jgi:hypothetical protein